MDMTDNVILTDEDIAEAQDAGYAAHIAHCAGYITMKMANEREQAEMAWFAAQEDLEVISPDLLAKQDLANKCWAKILELANDVVAQ